MEPECIGQSKEVGPAGMSRELRSSASAFRSDVMISLILSQQEGFSIRMLLIFITGLRSECTHTPWLGWCEIDEVITSLRWT